MPAPDLGPRYVPSLLDRLTDPDAAGHGVAVGYSAAQMAQAVKDDLSDLLNAKLGEPDLARDCPVKPRPGEPRTAACYGTGRRAGPVCGTCCPELRRSLLSYGLPDLSAYDATSEQACWALARVIEGVISQHEPRLRNVRVTVPRNAFNAVTRELHFHVEAALAADAASRLDFATVLELVSGEAKVDPPARAPR
jgi:type VI secretion system protein ImpF